MDHNDIRHKLSEYIDGTLTPHEKASVEDHLKTCLDCSNALAELQKTVEHIRKIEEIEPPAWLTQKIMANVRAEEEKKKQGLFHRIFFPLHVKLPLETIGALFIAATVYFVAQDVQETKRTESPLQTYSEEQERADKGALKDDTTAESSRQLQRKKEVPQEPEYKALDMKPAYEGPKPPVPAPAPESMRQADEQGALKYEPSRGRSTEQAAPESMLEQAPPAAMAKKNADGFGSKEKKAATARTETIGRQRLTLVVSDVDQAAAEVENAVKEFGGKITRKEPAGGALSLSVAIDDQRRNSFIDRLNALGELKEEDTRESHKDGAVIDIRIIKQVQQN